MAPRSSTYLPLGVGLLAVLAVAACEKTTTEHRLDGPMRLALGDCATADTRFISGHKPTPLSPKADKDRKNLLPARPGALGLPSGADEPDAGKPKRAPEPTGPVMRITKAISRGQLDEGVIRRTIEARREKLLTCYRRQRQRQPGLAGTIVVNFTIQHKGKVFDSAAAGVSLEVAACVENIITGIRFPRPDAGEVKVRYSLKFSPNADADRDPALAAGVRPGARPATRPTADADSQGRRDIASAAGSGAQKARAAAIEGLKQHPGYAPGRSNPLGSYNQGLLDCFRAKVPEKRPYGAMLLDIAERDNGHVVVAATSDTKNGALESCVARAIGKAPKKNRPTTGLRRCALAFGENGLGDAEGIDITETDISAGRRRRGDLASVLADAESPPNVPGLAEWLDRLQTKRRRLDHKPLVNDQPLVVRPLGSTPMKAVMGVLAEIEAAGMDSVLAVSQASGWRPVHPVTLPVVPVPRDTGAGWTLGRRSATSKPSKVPINASLYIGPEDVWIGISRVEDFRRFSTRNGGFDLDAFARGLRDVKKNRYFVDRADLEIAADDLVSYDTVVTFIDLAIAAGFTDWRLTTYEHLSAPPAE